MEFDFNISKLQGTLLSLESRGLINGSDLTEAVETLENLFESVAQDEIKSKMVFFMVLNADLTVLKKLQPDDEANLFVCISPALNFSKVLEIIWELKLQKCFNEVVENCHGSMVVEIVELFRNNPKFWKLNDKTEHIFNLWSSLFVKIHVSEKFQPADSDPWKLASCFENMYNSIKKLLKTSLRTHESQARELVGKNLLQFFKSVLFIVKLYKNEKYEFKPNKTFHLDFDLQPKVDLCKVGLSKSCLNFIFLNLEEVMELVTVEFWMSLSDLYLESSCTDSIQKMLGEIIYYICEEMHDEFPKALKCLEGCKIKPKSDFEKIAECEIDEIISNIEKGKKNWFKALIGSIAIREETVFANDELKLKENSIVCESGKESVVNSKFYESKIVDCLLKNLDLADKEDIDIILKGCLEVFLAENQTKEFFSNYRKLFFMALKYVQKSQYLEELSEVIERNPQISAMFEIEPDSTEMESFNEKLNKVFNQASTEGEIELSDFFSLCLQVKETTLNKICRLAVNNTEIMGKCIYIISTLRCAFVFHPKEIDCPSLLENVLWKFIMEETLSEKEKKLFASFLSKLGKLKFIDWSFYRRIFSILNSHLKMQNYEEMIFLLKLTQSGLELESFDKNKSFFFVSMCQILNGLSWNLESFSSGKSVGKNLAGHLVIKKMGKLNFEDFDMTQMLESLSNCCEINQAYFCDMLLKFNGCWMGSSSFPTLLLTLIHSKQKFEGVLSFMSDLYNSKEPNFVKYSVIVSLAMLLPLLTIDQWDSLFGRLKTFYEIVHSEGKEIVSADFNLLEVFASAIFLLTLQLNRNPKMSSCYGYGLRNFGRLIGSFGEESDSFLMLALEKTVFILHEIEDGIAKETFSLVLSPVLIDLVKKIRKKNCDRSKIDRLITVLNVKKLEESINKHLAD